MNVFGASNSFFGYRSGVNNDDGTHSSFIGYQSGSGNRDGGSNVVSGSNAGSKNSKGYRNTFVGASADQVSTSDSLDRALVLEYNGNDRQDYFAGWIFLKR